MFQAPYFYHNNMAIPFTMRGMNSNLMNNFTRGATRGLSGNITRGGVFSRLTNSLGFFKNINWGSFINNASKTLGVINQTIPLVKQAGPMFRNVKSVLKLASVFKDETDPIKNNHFLNNINERTNKQNYTDTEKKIVETFNNQPTFFIN